MNNINKQMDSSSIKSSINCFWHNLDVTESYLLHRTPTFSVMVKALKLEYIQQTTIPCSTTDKRPAYGNPDKFRNF